MSNLRGHIHRHQAVRVGTIDAAGRLAIGRNDRIIGPGVEFAAAFAQPGRLVIRFLDRPEPPDGWVTVPVIRRASGYPHVRLTGSALRPLLKRARLLYPVRVRFKVAVESSQIIVSRVR